MKPDDKELIEAVSAAASAARNSWLTLIGICAFILVSTFSVEHRDFLLIRPVTLPLMAVDVPINDFFVYTPLLIVIVHCWCIVSHVVFVRRAELAFSAGSGNISERSRIAMSPYLLAQELYGPTYNISTTILLRSAKWVALFILPVATLLIIQASYLPVHDLAVTWWHRICISLSTLILLSTRLFSSGEPREREPGRSAFRRFLDRVPIFASGPIIAMALSFGVFTTVDEHQISIPGVIGDDVDLANRRSAALFSRNLIVPFATLSSQQLIEDTGERLSLRDRDLRYAVLIGSNFDLVDFTAADVQGANLDSASLNGAMLNSANFVGANLIGASLMAADMSQGNFSVTDLSFARMDGARARNAIFLGADLYELNAAGADFLHADLRLSNLRNATLTNAVPPPWEPEETEWSYGVNFEGIRTSGNTLSQDVLAGLLRKASEGLSITDRSRLENRIGWALRNEDVALYSGIWNRLNVDKGSTTPSEFVAALISIGCRNISSRHYMNGLISSRFIADRVEARETSFSSFHAANAIIGKDADCPGASFLSASHRAFLQELLQNANDGLPLWIMTNQRDANVPTVAAGGEFSVRPGVESLVYGARASACDAGAPNFSDLMRDAIDQGLSMPSDFGYFYNAGVSSRHSNSCGHVVPTRVIGFVAANAAGKSVDFDFFGDRVAVSVESN